MQIELIKIGNSKGIRLPQNIIRHCGFTDIVDVEIINNCLVLKAPNKSRVGWEKIFKLEANTEGDERNEILAMKNRWDEEEWEW